jgi:hypothetical protein
MTEIGTRDIQPLNLDVLVTPCILIVTSNLPPGIKQAMFNAIASTLIYGKQDVVLVDVFMTIKQVYLLAFFYIDEILCDCSVICIPIAACFPALSVSIIVKSWSDSML